MSRRNPVYSPYRQAQINARRRAHVLSIESLRRVDRSIETFADDLSRVLGTLPEGESARQSALARALQIIQTRVRVRLKDLLQVAVSTGRQTSFDAILGIQNDATLAVARATEIPNNLLGAVRTPNVTMAGAWESLGTGSATWKTLLSRYSDGAVDDVQRVVTVSMTAGVSPDELAKRLRPYVRGAETLPEAMKGVDGLSDRDLAQLLNNPATAQSARTLRHNAARIAFSEVHNARGEAEVQAFAADPFVNAVRWQLSPNRGTQTEPDVCDALADSDFFGLGKGVYPVTKVPVSPHPWDRSLASWTPVLTERGWVRVDSVLAGDRVLTHRGRWQEVTESVHGRVSGTWLRLTDETGRVLTITSDHKVLLASGEWVLAGSLTEGSLLVGACDAVNNPLHPVLGCRPVVTPRSLSVEDDKGPAIPTERRSLSLVLEALAGRAVPAPMNLEGQAVRGDSEVQVEALEGVEREDGDALSGEPMEDGRLVLTEALSVEDGDRPPVALLVRLTTSEPHPASLAGSKPALGLAHALAVKSVSLRLSSARNTESLQSGGDDVPTDSQALTTGNLTQLLANVQSVQLRPVRLIHIERLSAVYQRYCLIVAKDNSFVASGVVVHNCERVPVTRPLSEVDRPKPNPDRVLPFAEAQIRGADTMTAQERDRIVRQVGSVFVTTASSGSPRTLDQLTSQAAVGGLLAVEP